MGAAHAEVRPTSATMANLAVYAALAQPGDTIAVLPGWAGGHLSHHAVGAAGIRGLRVAELPYDAAALDVDVPALPAFLAAERPRLVVIGASLMLFPHDVPAIAQAVNDAGATLLYDASHVAGLLAERRFQAPLREGADLVTFSTYKSFGGPPGGAIVTDDARLAERVATAVYPGLTANYDAARMVPLATAALAHLDSAGGYADACVATARALGAALHGDGLPLVGAARGFTASHHLCVDARGFGGGKAAALRLAEAGILLSEIGLPVADGPQDAGGLRIGTQAIVRQGLSPEDAPAIAAVVARVLGGEDPRTVAPDVAAVRRRGT
jgi:glycine hydroxymethyltransferase